MPKNQAWNPMNAMFSHLMRPNLSFARIGIVSALDVVEDSKFELSAISGNRSACNVFCEQIDACNVMMNMH